MSDDKKTISPNAGEDGTPVTSPVLTCSKDNPNAESKTKDNRIDIVFDPDKSKKVNNCNKIVHVQAVQIFVDGKPVKVGSYSSTAFGFRDQFSLANGTHVDALETETTPDYQQADAAGKGKKNGSPAKKAKMSDAPGTSGGDKGFFHPTNNPSGIKKYNPKFETFAYCMEGSDCGTWYEGITWEYEKTWEDHRDGKKGVSKITDSCIDKPSKNLIDAFNKFNKEKSFISCK